MPTLNKTLSLIALWLSVMILAGCQNMAGSDSSIAPFPAEKPAPGKALLYVFRANIWQQKINKFRLNLVVDHHIIDEISSEDYFVLELWPGQYEISLELIPGKFLGKHYYASAMERKTIKIKEGDVNLLGFRYPDPNSRAPFHNFYTEWPYKSGALNDKTLSRKVPYHETAQVTRAAGGSWEGPASGRLAHGVGTLSYSDGRRYTGLVKHGQLTPDGILTFPNGDTYKGEYGDSAKPRGQGVLSSPSGDILFSGNFLNGKPYGQGASLIDGKTGFVEYNHWTQIDTSPDTLARRTLARQDDATLANTGTSSQPLEEAKDQLNTRLATARQTFERQEAQYPGQCRCAFTLCLDPVYRDESPEDKAARKKAWNDKMKACREWKSSGGTYAERKARLDRQLERTRAQLTRTQKQLETARKKDAAEKKRMAAKLEQSRAERLAALREDIEQQQRANLETQRQNCMGKEHYCSCAAFRPTPRQSGPLTCSQ